MSIVGPRRVETPATLETSAPGPWPTVSIIVLNWNKWSLTVECLESLRRMTYPSYEVVVVDNGSTDGSVERIRAWARGDLTVDSRYLAPCRRRRPVPLQEIEVAPSGSPARPDPDHSTPFTRGFILVKVAENRGFTGGNNIAMRYALRRGAEWVFLLNNDAVADPNVLSTLITAARVPGIGMVTPTVLDYADPTRIDRQGIVLTRGGLAYERKGVKDGPLLCPDGCAALYSRPLLDAVCDRGQYFDEDLFAYGEDVDLGIRALRKGFRAALADGGVVYHRGGASLGGMDSAESLYLRHRNTIWIILKDLPTRTLLRNAGWIVLAQIGTLARGLTGAGRMFVLRGKIDGIKGIRGAWAKRRTLGDDIEDLPMVSRVFLPGRRRPQALCGGSSAPQRGRVATSLGEDV